MISNLIKEFIEHKEKSQEIQKRQELKLQEFQQQNISAFESLEISKVNFYDFENIRKDLEKVLDETTEEFQRTKSDPNNILNVERLESLMLSFDSYKKESITKIANMEADLVLFKSQVLEMLETNHFRLNDFQDNINLSLEIHERNIKKLERGKVTYEDLESMRNDFKCRIDEKEPEDIQKPIQEKDIENLTLYLYQDSFADSSIFKAPVADSSIFKAPVADSSIFKAPFADSSTLKPPIHQILVQTPRNNKEINNTPQHQTSRYILKPSSRLTEIEKRLASLRSDFFYKKHNVRSSTFGSTAEYPFKSFENIIKK